MLGAMLGDMIGMPYEFDSSFKEYDFPLFIDKTDFTDDTVCTVAVADWLINQIKEEEGLEPAYFLRKWCGNFPRRGYGAYFARWVVDPSMGAYGSWGNGSAMRVSAVGWLSKDKDEVLDLARKSAEPTHGHEDAVTGAQATALAIFRATQGASKEDILTEIREDFGYKLDRTVDEIRPDYRFYVDCKRTVPPSIISALEADSFEGAVRNAISLGGDADTMAAIAGSIAEPLYGIPEDIAEEGIKRLAPDMVDLYVEFLATLKERRG
jgi:ADP-ribosylglycohydrolase